MSSTHPTADQIRAARHNSFVHSVAHLPAQTQDKIKQSYARQDANRERNVGTFVGRIKGQQ